MSQLVIVARFTYPHQAQVMKTLLEAEGIHCFLQDELTAQVNNFYSNAIGGVKLSVMDKDVERAAELLREAGYEDKAAKTTDWLRILDRYASKIPILNQYDTEKRVILFIVVSILLLAVIINFLIYMSDTV